MEEAGHIRVNCLYCYPNTFKGRHSSHTNLCDNNTLIWAVPSQGNRSLIQPFTELYYMYYHALVRYVNLLSFE